MPHATSGTADFLHRLGRAQPSLRRNINSARYNAETLLARALDGH